MKLLSFLPNIISFSRLLGCFFVPMMLEKGNHFGASLIFFYLAFSDFLDGFVARRLGQHTDFGAMIDPLADKVCFSVILMYFLFKQWWPFWIVIVIVGRDLGQILCVAFLWKTYKNKKIIAPSWVSKVNTAIIFFAMFISIGNYYFFYPYLSFLWGLIILLTLWSACDYFKKFFIN